MIKLRIQPIVRAVALFAGCRVSEGDVVRGRGFFKVCFMTRNAQGGHGLELTVGGILVAGIAIDCGVSAGEREAIVV